MTDWLLGTLVATSALTLMVLCVREPVRRHFGSRIAYGLWLIPAARLLMPTLTHTVERQVQTQVFAPEPALEPRLLASLATPDPSLIDQLGGWPTALFILWIGIALGIFAARLIAYRRDRSVILSSAVQLARLGSIRIVRSSAVSGPLAFGILDRVIAVPADFDRLYEPEERRLALDHELSHHQSGDLVANFFAFVLLCLQWFNPLAWVAHAAFRFDQEAACDARVLDKAKARDRAQYGRVIAKAASGRALLFASALDRRNRLHRRLKSMLSNPTAGRRTVGRLMVFSTVAIALPLTATRAIEYVDPPAAPVAPATPQAPALAAAAQPAMPAAPATPADPAVPKHKEVIVIDGKTKRWSDLGPEERARIRASIAEAREELAQNRIDRVEILGSIDEARSDQAEMLADLAEARGEIARAMQEIDANSAHLRRAGQDPETIKKAVRQSLVALQRIDFEGIDRKAIENALAAAQQGMRKAEEELDRLDVDLTAD